MKRFFNLLSIASILTLFLIVSCNKDESENNYCNVSNPTEELPWLKTMITELSDFNYIMTANYKGKTIFYNRNCDPLVNYASSVFNCSGENIAITSDIDDEFSDVSLLWKHTDSKCSNFD